MLPQGLVMMKTLIISQFYPPDITAAAFRISDTADLLARSGHEVQVITSFPHKVVAEEENQSKLFLPDESVHRCRLRKLGGPGLIPYVRHYLSFVRGSILASLKVRKSGWRPDVIWASSPPLFTGISGYISAKIFRCPWVLDVRDIWPESAVAAGQLREGGRAFRIGKWLERFLYNHANHITCVSEPMKKHIGGLTDTPVDVVYNGAKGSTADLQETGGRKGKGTNRVLLYAGNLGRVQALDTLIRAIADMDRAGDMEGWNVHLLGAGAVKDELAAQIKELHVEHRVTMLPPVSREEVDTEASQADALFLSLKPDPVLRMTIPSKLFDYLAVNRPIVAGIAGEGAMIASRTGGNIVYEPASYDGLKSALKELYSNIDRLQECALGNCALLREKFTRERSVSVLNDVLYSVVKKRGI